MPSKQQHLMPSKQQHLMPSKQQHLMPTAILLPETDTDADTASSLRPLIGRLSRRLRPTFAGAAAGLTPTRTTVLLQVVREGPIRLSDLAASESLNPTMLSRVVSQLCDAGLLERSSDAGDRRAAWVDATPKGHRLAERMRRERTDALNLALATLGDRDRRHIEKALPALAQLAEALRERPE